MRYTLVTETYPPEVNGVALTLQQLERGLRARGHDVCVVRPRRAGDARPGSVPPAEDELLVPGTVLPLYRSLHIGLPVAGRLATHWRLARPDAIYVATEGPLGWAALQAARRLRIPAATGLHTRFDLYAQDYGLPFLSRAARHWMRHFHNSAQATLVPTRQLHQSLLEQGYRRPVRLARAVDTARFSPRHRDPGLRDAWGIAPDGLAVIHVGRIAAEKNLALAVRAFRALQARRPEARFVWVGDGPLRAALARDNPDFLFQGTRHGADLARHYASADLFLFPSRSETFGNVTLEAMASGIASIAFDEGAAREHLRHGLHGACVGDDEAFVAEALRLAADDGLRHAMGTAARAATQGLSPGHVAEAFDRLLAGLCASPIPMRAAAGAAPARPANGSLSP